MYRELDEELKVVGERELNDNNTLYKLYKYKYLK